MVRHRDWKYIFIANGGREQLFNLKEDPNELKNLAGAREDVARELRAKATAAADKPGARAALDNGGLRKFSFQPRPCARIYQFDRSRGVSGFPEHPGDVLRKTRG
jgi:choline-sulfatase